MMGWMQRDKGARIEREVVELNFGLGLRAERVPLSGASRCQGNGADVDVYLFPDGPPLCGEVKARANVEGFATLERRVGYNDFLALRRSNAEPLIVVPWRIWARLVVRGGLK
jgi:Holliday junction resolvase